MVLQEKIQKKAEGYGRLAPVFLESAKFALENQWISVEEDLPCNHKELIHTRYNLTTRYVVTNIQGFYHINRMLKYMDKWVWEIGKPTHWFSIPEPPKE